MADFIASAPITVRQHELFTLTCDGHLWRLNGQIASFTSAAEILGNAQHHMRTKAASLMPRIESGELAGIARGDVSGKVSSIPITKADYAPAAAEIERFAAWQADAAAGRTLEQQRERAFDRGVNEGGEGFNPHRAGAARTYVGK